MVVKFVDIGGIVDHYICVGKYCMLKALIGHFNNI
jgi:hypothetical protein